jgi:cobalt-zinc-cadmium efflux system protein
MTGHVRLAGAIVVGLLAGVLPTTARAGTVTTDNACFYSYNGEYRNQLVTLGGTGSPNGAAAGTVATLSGASVSAMLPPSLPEAGYGIGAFHAGVNPIPAKVWLAIAAGNATPAVQVRELSVTTSTTIVDDSNGFVSGTPIVVTAAVGLAVNVVASYLLSRADRTSLNIAGAFAHVLTDAYAFAATIVAGVVVITTGWHRADPVASLAVVVLMLIAAVPLLRKSGTVLLDAAPEHVDLDELRTHLLETGDGHVLGVHDLHAWTVGSGLPAVSAHVVVTESCFDEGAAPRLLDELQHCLAGHFDVEHSTFQFEREVHVEHEPQAHL